jgi:hypothetical protein
VTARRRLNKRSQDGITSAPWLLYQDEGRRGKYAPVFKWSHFTSLLLCYAGQGRIWAPLGSSVPSTTHANDHIDGLAGTSKGVSAGLRTSLKIHCFCRLPGWARFIPHSFLLTCLTITATKIYVTLNHSKIVFKFISAISHRLPFVYDICLVPARKYYFLLLYCI